MMHEKTIVTDLDDTLSYTSNRDWENAKPNLLLIDKLNSFYDAGYKIIILTARGQISCGGDSEKADRKYRVQIEKWLKKYNVKYSELSFNKPFESYYIDDKAILPSDFLHLDSEEFKGMSGAYIVRHGDIVHKTHNDSASVIEWYKIVKGVVNIPEIYKVIGNTISMEYIRPIPTPLPNVNEILKEISKLKDITHVNNSDFSTYVNRIRNHLSRNNLNMKYVDKLLLFSDYYNENKSFCHGDSAIDNFIFDGKDYYMIDPIYNPDLYSSWLLDVSKIMQSLKRFGYKVEYSKLKKFKTPKIKALEMAWWIRFYKYTDRKDICAREIEELYHAI